MKTNISIELDDDSRDCLANLIDQNDTKRLASRNDIKALVEQHLGGLVREAQAWTFEDTEEDDDDQASSGNDLYIIDDGDREIMAHPDNPSYVRGWNQVKGAKS